jgi:flagellar M-ring protein FliF
VVNLQFAARPDTTAAGVSAPGLFDFTRDDLMNMAEMAVTLIVGLALVLFVMRPLLKRVLAPEPAPRLALSQVAEPAPPAPMPAASEAPAQPVPPAWINNAKSIGEVQAQTLKQVGTLVDDNPSQAATIVRDWLSSPA